MTPEHKRKIAKGLSIVVSMASVMVIIGWIFNINVLKSISPSWICMKFDTAITFLLSGITLYFIVKALEGEFDKSQVILSITCLIIALLMGTLFFSNLFRVNTGAENLFIKETTDGVKTVTPGRPSTPSMINFLLIATAGILTTFGYKSLPSRLKIIGLIIGTIGGIAVAGYIINVPFFYYYIPGINSAMACHTAILFVLLGMGLLCL